MPDKAKCGNKNCDYQGDSLDNGCMVYTTLDLCADYKQFKRDGIDPTCRTCNLCGKQEICTLKTNIHSLLEDHKNILGNDYSDIMLGLAYICDNFEEES